MPVAYEGSYVDFGFWNSDLNRNSIELIEGFRDSGIQELMEFYQSEIKNINRR